MADLVEQLGGAIVSPHSQSGIHLLHMIRILKERGKLDLVKGIIIPESAIGLDNFVRAGITPQDFDHIPYMHMNGDYRPGNTRIKIVTIDCRNEREPDSLRRTGNLC